METNVNKESLLGILESYGNLIDGSLQFKFDNLKESFVEILKNYEECNESMKKVSQIRKIKIFNNIN